MKAEKVCAGVLAILVSTAAVGCGAAPTPLNGASQGGGDDANAIRTPPENRVERPERGHR